VTQPESLFHTWQMSQAWKCRPSAVYGIEAGSFEAYAFDSAVTRWGMAFEAALSNAGGGNAKDPEAAQRTVIRRWLPSQRQYANPADR
jgi:hypothetical protein